MHVHRFDGSPTRDHHAHARQLLVKALECLEHILPDVTRPVLDLLKRVQDEKERPTGQPEVSNELGELLNQAFVAQVRANRS